MRAVGEQTLIEPMLEEFREEAAIMQRVLERVPADKLLWRPHPKSMTLGQLAWHVAATRGSASNIAQQESFDVTQASFGNRRNRRAWKRYLPLTTRAFATWSNAWQAAANWRLMRKEHQIFSRLRINVLRGIMLNHWYHHRGQLSVYPRLLDVPVPTIYGRSADESSFA